MISRRTLRSISLRRGQTRHERTIGDRSGPSRLMAGRHHGRRTNPAGTLRAFVAIRSLPLAAAPVRYRRDQVDRLRAAAWAGEPKAALAREFGISRETVKPISPRRRYLNRAQHGRHSIAAGDSTVTSTPTCATRSATRDQRRTEHRGIVESWNRGTARTE